MADLLTQSSPPPTQPPLLIDIPRACEVLSMGARKLFDLTKSGAIPSRKIQKSVRYVPAELQAWIDAGCPTSPGAGDQIRKGMTP